MSQQITSIHEPPVASTTSPAIPKAPLEGENGRVFFFAAALLGLPGITYFILAVSASSINDLRAIPFVLLLWHQAILALLVAVAWMGRRGFRLFAIGGLTASPAILSSIVLTFIPGVFDSVGGSFSPEAAFILGPSLCVSIGATVTGLSRLMVGNPSGNTQ
jgi:hypothetical protein